MTRPTAMAPDASTSPVGHTPGPWWVAGKGTIRAGDMDWIGSIHFRNRAANARLIAAAPELLEALQEAADLCVGTFAEGGSPHKRMLAAIAKARGEQA